MQRLLILFAHPALEKSRVNRRLLSVLEAVDGVVVHDLYEEYPDFAIDVRREQGLLVDHDLVILQHPFFWYSVPPLLKQWVDLVLEHGWAYGSGGTALAGKPVLSAITTGGSEETYCRGGVAGFSMRELLAPIEQTFALCGMIYLPPFVVHGAHGMREERLERAATSYRRAVEALRDGRLDVDGAARLPRLSGSLDELLRAPGDT